jgi:hypothetical protein
MGRRRASRKEDAGTVPFCLVTLGVVKRVGMFGSGLVRLTRQPVYIDTNPTHLINEVNHVNPNMTC